MKKNKTIEMRIYELLGVNIFRKYILFVWEKIAKLIKFDVGYRIDKLNFEKINNYKIRAKGFATAHLFLFIESLFSSKSISNILFMLLFNGYCIMVQRYNCIRINQVIKKMTPRYEEQKEKIKYELIKEDALFLEHTYKIIDKKSKETNLTFEELIRNTSIEELNEYREYLLQIQDYLSRMKERGLDIRKLDLSMPFENNKILKLEFKKNKSK